jgi:hypothetical protein
LCNTKEKGAVGNLNVALASLVFIQVVIMLKGIGHQKNIIVGWPLKIIQYFLYMCKWLFKTALLKRKVNVRF